MPGPATDFTSRTKKPSPIDGGTKHAAGKVIHTQVIRITAFNPVSWFILLLEVVYALFIPAAAQSAVDGHNERFTQQRNRKPNAANS